MYMIIEKLISLLENCLYVCRYLCTLKGYVTNKVRPEGSIADAYIVNECLTFVSMYLCGCETKFNKDERNYDGGNAEEDSKLSVFTRKVRPFGAGHYFELAEHDYDSIHRYVLNNCESLDKYIE